MKLAYPFSLVSGSGLGVSYSSFTQIGSAVPSRDFGELKVQSFVNASTGNLIIFDHKLVLQEKNFPVELYYVYNSHAQSCSSIWRLAHKYFKSIPSSSSTRPRAPLAILVEEDGHETSYQLDDKSGRWLSPYWSESRPYLCYDAPLKQWKWFDPKTQITEIYNELGYLIQRLGRKNEITTYRYDQTKTPWQLTVIEAPSHTKYEIRYQRFADGGHKESIYRVERAQSTLLKESMFDFKGRLSQTTIALENNDRSKWPKIDYKYRFSNSGTKDIPDEKDIYWSAYLQDVKQSDGSCLSFSYGSTDLYKLRPLTRFNYQNSPDTGITLANFSYERGRTIIQNYAKVSTTLHINADGAIAQVDREQGYPSVPRLTSIDSVYYTYHENGQLADITSPGQGKKTFQYNIDGLLAKQQKANGQITEYYYDQSASRHNLITEVSYVDSKALVTRKIYDQTYGQTHSGLYLQFEISPEGRVTEYRLGEGDFIQYTIVYLDERFSVDNYSINEVPSLEEMVQWVTQQNPQRVALSKRIFDHAGQLSHTYHYGTVDEKGKGIDNDQVSELFTVYNIFGDLYFHSESFEADKPTLDTFSRFDNLRRLVSFTNAANENTSYRYENRCIEITRPNGRSEITELDTRGWICREQQAVKVNSQLETRLSTYSRNIVGGTTEKCTPADGQYSYQFYDKQNRLGFIVHPSGYLTEYRYNQQSRYKATVRYAKAIDKAKLASVPLPSEEPSTSDLFELMKSMAIDDPAHDRVSYEFYDSSGRLHYQVDEEAYICQNVYDERDRLIMHIKHEERLPSQQLTALLNGKNIVLAIDPARDRVQRTFYDGDNQVIGLQDAGGYVIEYKRNGANWVTEIIRYAQCQAINVDIQSFDKIRPDASSDDAHEYNFYDPRGWVILSVDPEGYVRTKRYLLNGQLLSEKCYVTPVDPAWYTNTQLPPSLPADSPEDQSTSYQYNALNREIESHHSDGKITFTHYDNMGEVSARGLYDALSPEINGDTYRAKEFRLDGWGQIIAEASTWTSEALARIEADKTLTPAEKQTQKEVLWRQNSQRHVYDATGLKLSTAVRANSDTADQLTYYYYNTARHSVLTIQVIAEQQFAICEYTRDRFNDITVIREYSQVQTTFPDKFNEPLTGGFLSESLRKALDALQDDAHDIVTHKGYNKRSEVIQVIDAEGYETKQNPNAFYEVSESHLPVQNKQPGLIIQHQFESRGLEISTQSQVGDTSIEVKSVYNNLYGKPTQIWDELKGHYQKGYDRKGRLIWTQAPRHQQKSSLVYDAWDRLTKVSNALGETTQYLYEQSKRKQTIIDPLGNKRWIVQNVFSEKIIEIDSNQQTQSWQHAADGQISRYDDALDRGYYRRYNLLGQLSEQQIVKGSKTCYRYNALGKRISKTEDVDGIKRQIQYHYNLLGQCITIIDPRGVIQQNTYDRCANVIKQCIDPSQTTQPGLAITTTRRYNGQGQLLCETVGDDRVADQYTSILTYDGFNRHCGTTIDPSTETRQDALNIHTQHHKNGHDTLIADIDANGHITRFIYDSAGRRCFQINPLRGVTEWKYNEADQIILERQYQQSLEEVNYARLNDETTTDQLGAMLKRSAEDTQNYRYYDANGCHRFTVVCCGQKGFAQEKRYDAVQREVQTIHYATPIDIHAIESLSCEQLAAQLAKHADPTQDRIKTFLRDEVGQLRFSIDSQNYIQEQRFDAQGHLVLQVNYANPITDPATLIKLPIEQVITHIKRDDSQDRYQYFFFDTLEQPLYTVNAEGQVIRYQHDANGNLLEEVHFKQRVSLPQDDIQLLQQLNALKPDSAQDRITRKTYDAANRLIQQRDALGYVESYQYDALNNRIIYSDRQQAEWKTIFDRAKRPIVEITPPTPITQVTQDESGTLVPANLSVAIEKHKVYDKVGNICRIITAANTTESRVFEAEYNALKQWQVTRLPGIAVDNGSALKLDDWRYRPEIKQTLTCYRTTNAKGLKVAEQDHAGHWQFWVYDEQKRLIYHVKPLGITIKKERDAFGKIRRKITYATPCTLDLSVYSKTGIPKSILDSYYQTRNTELDRIISYQRDQHGRIILQRQGPVYCYTSDIKPGSEAHVTEAISQQIAEISKTYNAWGQRIYQKERIGATRNKEYLYWFNRNGQCVAEVDIVGLENQTPRYRCKRYELDSFDQIIRSHDYAELLEFAITPRLSFAELSKALDQIESKQDRRDQFYYDHAGHLLKKTREQVVRQTLQLTDGLPTFTDTPPEDISITYQYNPNGQRVAKTHEDGHIERSCYDKRGCKLAQTDVPRDNNGLSTLLVPLTYYGNNAHGQVVLTTRFKQGTKPTTDNSFPQPLAIDPADQQEQQLFDARGKLYWKQNNNQKIPRGFSYTANGKLARQWWIVSNWQQKEGNQYEKQTYLDEKYFQYDAQDRTLSFEIRRNNQSIETSCSQYDAFDQVVFEGEKSESKTIYRHFDKLGRLWSSNAESGIPILYLYDLSGQCTLRMQSARKDLSIISYEEIPNLLSWDITDLERVENQRDLAGRVVMRTLPANYQYDPSQPQMIPLSMLASHLYPNLGKIQSLSWPIPQEQNVQAEFSLWPKDLSDLKQILPIITQAGRCGVDVSALATDIYDYQISYYFTDPADPSNTNAQKRLLYLSSGTIQFDTGHVDQSRHLVAITDQKHKALVRLVGNTRDINAVELWQDIEKKATLDLHVDPVTLGYYIDISQYASGVYQIKPQTHDKKEQAFSLPFTVYTDKPAHKPLSRELTSALDVYFLENHVAVNWKVPTFLQAQPVKLKCNYVDIQDKPQLQECNIDPSEKRTTYSDKTGKEIQSNVDFVKSIKFIKALSLAVQWPVTVSEASPTVRLDNQWVMLGLNNEFSSKKDEDWEFISDVDAAPVAEKDSWIPLYVDAVPAAPSFEPDLISELSFGDKRLVMVSPVSELKTQEESTLEYLDVSLDRMRCWKQFETISLIPQGFVVDMTGFTAGVYPFRYGAHSGDLVITLEGQIFPSPTMIEPDRQHLVQPARRYSYDRWNNRINETDSLGHTTQFFYNDADQLIQKQEPEAEVVDEQGIVKTLCPITTFGYNVRGISIGTRDANGNTRGFIVDTAGHRIIEVLADGTQRKTQCFDALNNIYETRDATGHVTQYRYDAENNLLEYQRPSGSRLSYSYNEVRQRISDTDPAGNTRRYNFDALGNVNERYEPLGQCTRMIYGRYHQLIKIKNPDGSHLSWERDAFGKPLQHIDLSGALYHYQYDSKGQLIEASSQGGNHGQCLKLQPLNYQFFGDWYRPKIVPVPGQRLKYQYISGRNTELADLVEDKTTYLGGKTTYYSYDTEGRRTGVRVISQAGELIRETSVQNDALGREVLTHDNKAVFTTAYDAVSNRRYIKGVVNIGDGKTQATQEVWWKYDTQDRVTLSEGIFENGQIKLSPNQGTQFTYKDDRRVTETELDKSGNEVTSTLEYDVDGRLTGSIYSTGEKTQRQYHPAGWQTQYKDIKPPSASVKVHVQHDSVYNENGWLTAATQVIDEGKPIQTDYRGFTALGLPQQQNIHYNDEYGTEDHLSYNYVGWDSWRVAEITGYRSNRFGRSAYSSAKHFLGPNGEQNAIYGAKNDDDNTAQDTYFESTPDGLVVRRLNYTHSPWSDLFPEMSVRITNTTCYFYRVNGQPLGSYEYDQNSWSLGLNWVRHQQQNSAGRELGAGLFHGNNPGRAVSFDPLGENHGAKPGQGYGNDNYFANLPQTYITVAGDSYEAIAEKLYGDSSLAPYVEAANGGVSLIAGQTLMVPRLIVVHNKAGMARPYYELLQIIQGRITPYLQTPQPEEDDGFWGSLLRAVVVVVISIVVPELAIVGSIALSLGVSEVVVAGVLTGLADAAVQGLCIGMGLEDHFSLAETLSVAISAGFAASSGSGANLVSDKDIMHYMLQMGMVNVTEQLAEMAIGIRQQFDLSSVALAMGTAGLGGKISKISKGKMSPWVQHGLTDLGASAMSGVLRGRFDVENLATQLLSDAAGLTVRQIQSKPSFSEAYRQIQQASHGQGKISQEIEQAWQSQLIADAESTATMGLPSISLDANSARLAERVGLEVSRFPHSMPVASNRYGFWRGVDDVLKMRQGTISAVSAVSSVFTGNFIGNYEAVPQDRWQAAGYLTGLPLAIGAGFLIREAALGAEAIQNVYKVAQATFQPLWNKAKINLLDIPNDNKFLARTNELVGNRSVVLSSEIAGTFSGNHYKSYVVIKRIVLYRAGAEGIPYGQFYSFDRPHSELQVRIDKAIRPVWPKGGASLINTGYAIEIPPGAKLHVGQVSSQGDLFVGGTKQIYIENIKSIPGVEVLAAFPLKGAKTSLWNDEARNILNKGGPRP